MEGDDATTWDTTPLHRVLGLEFARAADQAGDEGTAEVRMPARAGALGSTGNLHGGAIATMIDVACGIAAARATAFDHRTQSMVTVDMHIRYLGRARSDAVVARAQVVRAGSKLIVVECRVTDDTDHLIAMADFSMMIVPLRQPLPGYDNEAGYPEM